MGAERRNIKNRAAVVQRVIDGIVQNPSVTLTVNTLQTWLGVPMEAAQRILDRLPHPAWFAKSRRACGPAAPGPARSGNGTEGTNKALPDVRRAVK